MVVCEEVPRVAAGVDDVVVAFEDGDGEFVGAQVSVQAPGKTVVDLTLKRSVHDQASDDPTTAAPRIFAETGSGSILPEEPSKS